MISADYVLSTLEFLYMVHLQYLNVMLFLYNKVQQTLASIIMIMVSDMNLYMILSHGVSFGVHKSLGTLPVRL